VRSVGLPSAFWTLGTQWIHWGRAVRRVNVKTPVADLALAEKIPRPPSRNADASAFMDAATMTVPDP
jgi:hypothetical protein